jgi:hypothetical protein
MTGPPKTAIVTGASQGIGAGILKAFFERDFNVVANSRKVRESTEIAGELQSLKPEDIDLQGNWIHVRSQPGAETKTSEFRKVPIHSRLRALLAALPKSKHGWMFTTPVSDKFPCGGNRLNTKKLNAAFQKIVMKCGMPAGRDGGYTLHSLRHFFETFTVTTAYLSASSTLGSDIEATSRWRRPTTSCPIRSPQQFMLEVPFGSGETAAVAVKEG